MGFLIIQMNNNGLLQALAQVNIPLDESIHWIYFWHNSKDKLTLFLR